MNAIDIKGLEKSYKNFSLNIEDLEIKKGYITGFIGPNGSGKTTTIKSIMGMCKNHKGTISILGKNPLADLNVREDIGYIGEVPGFLEESSLKRIKKSISAFYKKYDDNKYNKLIHQFNLDENKLYSQLSKGQKKQFELALVLSRNPKVLIMDEPTSNLDPIVRNAILDILQNYMEENDATIFYSTHVTTDLDKCADYIVFLYKGKVILQGEKDIILDNYIIVKGKKDLLDSETKKIFVNIKKSTFGFEGLAKNKTEAIELFGNEVVYEKPTLEDIILFYTRGN